MAKQVSDPGFFIAIAHYHLSIQIDDALRAWEIRAWKINPSKLASLNIVKKLDRPDP